jgi:hypothetical protein
MLRSVNRFHACMMLALLGACGVAMPSTALAQDDVPATYGNKFPIPDAPPAAQDAPRGLAIRATAGSPDGPSIAHAPVTVQFISQHAVIDSLDAELDEHGVLMIEDELPAHDSYQPLVLVQYDGVTYTAVGPVMGDGAQANAVIDITCYAVTDEEPDWHVTMRHVLMDRGPDINTEAGTRPTIAVSEVLVLQNDGVRTWVGQVGSGTAGHRTTVFPLPAGVAQEHIQLDAGFNGWTETIFTQGALVNQLPLMPGSTEFRFQYLVPASDKPTTLQLPAPATINQLLFIGPQDLVSGVDPRLQHMGSRPMGERMFSQYMSSGLDANDDAVEVTLAGMTPLADAPAANVSGGSNAKLVTVIGVGLIVLIAVVMMLARGRKSAAS